MYLFGILARLLKLSPLSVDLFYEIFEMYLDYNKSDQNMQLIRLARSVKNAENGGLIGWSFQNVYPVIPLASKQIHVLQSVHI